MATVFDVAWLARLQPETLSAAAHSHIFVEVFMGSSSIVFGPVATNPIQSTGLRFFRTFGVSLFWACVFSLVFGGAAFFRVERRDLEGELRWHAAARLLLERMEWATFDWRARQLGAQADRFDDVVIVGIDEETLANTRESEHPEWAMNPWPRELLGGVVEQALREGAALVVIDQSLADVSPHFCAPCRPSPAHLTDDELLGRRLERLAGKVVPAFEWRRDARRSPDRPLTPFLLKVAELQRPEDALGPVREILTRRATAYLMPNGQPGASVLWAGSTTEAKARALFAELDLKGSPIIRPLTPADDERELNRDWLLAQTAQVQLTGADADGLPRAGAIDGPVPALLLPEAPSGSVTMTADSDGVVRALPLLIASNGSPPTVLPSAALQAVLRLARSRSVELTSGKLDVAGRFTVPVDAQAFVTLVWDAEEPGRAGQGTVKRELPAWRLLVNRADDDAERGVRHSDNDLIGRVVVLADLRRGHSTVATPVGTLSRAAVLAQAITNLLHGRAVSRVRAQTDFWLTVAFAVMGGVLAVVWSNLVRRPGWLAWVATIALIMALHALVARQLFVTQLRWVAMAAPLCAYSFTFLASLGYARTIERSLRDFVLRALGGAVRADVFRKVERDLALMQPERRELTIYFSDIEGFTAVAQSREPRSVAAVLQDYLGEMTTVILDHEGHVDKYLGDGLMAFWGAPVELPDAAAIACSAALAMQARFEKGRSEWERRCDHPLVLRAGIDTGPTLVGEMGTMHRVNYTVMGEPVAIAARLESLAKHYGSRILVGPAVVEAAGPRFVFREVDVVQFGRAPAPVRVSELLGLAVELEAEAPQLARFGAALAHYRARRFAVARAAFESLAQERRADRLVERYVARCRHYELTPPPAAWDGVFTGSEV